MIPYNDVPEEEAGRHLDEDVVDPLSRLPCLLPVLQPGLVAGGLNDLLVALSQLLDAVALSLQGKLRNILEYNLYNQQSTITITCLKFKWSIGVPCSSIGIWAAMALKQECCFNN